MNVKLIATGCGILVLGLALGFVIGFFGQHRLGRTNPVQLRHLSKGTAADDIPGGMLFEYELSLRTAPSVSGSDELILFVETDSSGRATRASIHYNNSADFSELIAFLGDLFMTFRTGEGSWGLLDLDNNKIIDVLRPFSGKPNRSSRLAYIIFDGKWVEGTMIAERTFEAHSGERYDFARGEWQPVSTPRNDEK